jgi:hypothetical protein
MERDERGGPWSPSRDPKSRDRQSCDLQSRDSHRRGPSSLPARVRMERVYRHAARASSVMADAQASRPATREAPGSIHSRPCPPHPCPEAPEPRGRPCGCRSGREWMRMAVRESSGCASHVTPSHVTKAPAPCRSARGREAGEGGKGEGEQSSGRLSRATRQARGPWLLVTWLRSRDSRHVTRGGECKGEAP